MKHGAVIDAKDKDNSTCLRLAIIRNESDWALALAKHGASFETAYLAGDFNVNLLRWSTRGPTFGRVRPEGFLPTDVVPKTKHN